MIRFEIEQLISGDWLVRFGWGSALRRLWRSKRSKKIIVMLGCLAGRLWTDLVARHRNNLVSAVVMYYVLERGGQGSRCSDAEGIK